jgi:Asp-tRNA(Asn)/Glu-tRNA(Gln) amidotransferase A subunit family amidase
MADKRLKARELVEACLDRIEAREGQVHAWEALDPRARASGPTCSTSGRGRSGPCTASRSP